MKIVMAHGSGGNATRELIKDIFQKYLANDYLDKMEDAAALPVAHYPLAMTTDSFVVTPLEFPGGDIGKLAVCGTVNDLWMSGAEPQYLTAGFILEEGLDIDLLDRIVGSLSKTAREAGIKIVAGDTKVVQGNGGLYINTAGLGYRKTGRFFGSENIRQGDIVIINGNLGNHHACILSQRMEINNSIHSDCADLGPMVRGLIDNGIAIRVMRDITRGGLGTVLNEIAESGSHGIEIEETQIPVDPEVKSFCDILGLDPLYMANEGKFLCIIAPEHADMALDILHQHPLGVHAQIIGKVADNAKPLVTIKTRLGGKRIIDVLYGEGLPRIC
ncbi:hydrogenase expression/formation protein HypE [Dehalobacter sp. DCM]|uniref:hydrogenase expression/formation protein HypE n=1 Tax=Dehalobacter sp. DCM TaxID=2907827 RepID=UPI0030812A56|nr:hydrogenase expression/formation protein HypE [Dehalobacter sp. DCM]